MCVQVSRPVEHVAFIVNAAKLQSDQKNEYIDKGVLSFFEMVSGPSIAPTVTTRPRMSGSLRPRSDAWEEAEKVKTQKDQKDTEF